MKHIVLIYFDKNLWQKLSNNGLNLVKQNWGKENGYHHLSEILSSINFKVKKPAFPLKVYEE